MDDWGLVLQPYLQMVDGGGVWSFVHSAGNDSRHDAPNLMHWALIALVRWHPVAQSLVCVFLGTFSAWVVTRFWKEHPAKLWTRLVLAWISVAVVLSPMQWMNWSWGIQICYLLMVAGTMLTWRLLTMPAGLIQRSALAVLPMWIAIFSFINGWLAFLLGFALLGLESWRTRPKGWQLALGLWLVAGLVAMVAYQAGAEVERPGGSMMEAMHEDPFGFVRFFLQVLGAPFSDWSLAKERAERVAVQAMVAVPVAVMSLAIGLRAVWRLVVGWKREGGAWALPWMVLGLWGLANAFAIAIARFGGEGQGAFHSRYPAFTLWFYIGLWGLCAGLPARHVLGRWWERTWLVVLVAGGVTGGIQGWADAFRIKIHGDLSEAAAALRHVAPEPVYLDVIQPNRGQAVITALDRLETEGLLHVKTLRDSRVPSNSAAADTFALGELVSGRLTDKGVVLEGWAVAANKRERVKAVAISMQPESGEEIWLGLATRLKPARSQAKRIGARVLEDRIGWLYEPMTGDERSFLRGKPLTVTRRPLVSGKTVFRAYAFDPVEGRFCALPGAVELELPPTFVLPPEH